jgi:hypothetical protein
MSRVTFFWSRWTAPDLNPEATARLISELNYAGTAVAIAKKKVPLGKPLVFSALIGIVVGGLLGSYSDAEQNREYARIFGTLGAIFFAWGIIQLPLHLGSVLFARHQCVQWLRNIERHGPRLIQCRFEITKAHGDKEARYQRDFTETEFRFCADQAKSDILSSPKGNAVPAGRYWELWARILTGTIESPSFTKDRCLAALASSISEVALFSDVYLITLQASGEITVQRIRKEEDTKHLSLGFLPMKALPEDARITRP